MSINVTPAMEANKRINEMRNENKIEQNKLNKSFGKILESRDDNHNQKVKAMANTQEKELSKANNDYQLQLDKNKEQFSQEIGEERKNLKEKLEEIREKNTQDLLDQRKNFKSEEEKLRDTYENLLKNKDIYLDQKENQYNTQQKNINQKLDNKLRASTKDIVDFSQQNIKNIQDKSDSLVRGLNNAHSHAIQKAAIDKDTSINTIRKNQSLKDEIENIQFKKSLDETAQKLIEKNKDAMELSRKQMKHILLDSNIEQNKLKLDFKNKITDIQLEFRKILAQKEFEMQEFSRYTQDLLERIDKRHNRELTDMKEHFEDKIKEITVDHGIEKQQLVRRLKEQYES